MADFLGLHVFSFNILPGAQLNAFTMPVDRSVDVLKTSNKLLADKNTFKYNKKANYSIFACMYAGLFTSDKFTNAEVMAILLHEIGHNFSAAIDGSIMVLSNVSEVIIIINEIIKYIIRSLLKIFKLQKLGPKVNSSALIGITPKIIRNIVYDINELVKEKFGFLNVALSVYLSVKAFISDTINNIIGVGDFFTGGLLNLPYAIGKLIYTGIIGMFVQSFSYKNEKIADAFAVAYGYGPETTSALYKMEYTYKGGVWTKEKLSKIPVVGAIQEIISFPADYIMRASDPHPDFIERHQSAIKQLRRELSEYNVDPSMRKVIEDNLKEIEKQQKEYLDTVNGLEDHTYIQKIYWAWLLRTHGGDLKHKAFDSDYLDKLDNAAANAIRRSR